MPVSLPTTVDPAYARELLDNHPRARLIDVRTPGEFAAAHIPGSANVPLDLLRTHHRELSVAHDDPIVLVCASGARAEQARSILEATRRPTSKQQAGVLHGGATAWEQAGGALYRGRGSWGMERQVRLTAGLLALAGVGLSTVYEPLKWIAGGIGAGLTVAALTNTCAMSRLLEHLPHNRTDRTHAAITLTALTEEHPHSKESTDR